MFIIFEGACNRSPGSNLLSITTQLHCGGHLGGRARLPDTILEEDHPITILSKFGSNWATGSRQEDFHVNFPCSMCFFSLKCQNSASNLIQCYCEKYVCQSGYECLQRYVCIHINILYTFLKWPVRTIPWLFHQSLVLIELLVPDKKVFMWISHRVLC
jgi:hypothetical protein